MVQTPTHTLPAVLDGWVVALEPAHGKMHKKSAHTSKCSIKHIKGTPHLTLKEVWEYEGYTKDIP